MHYTDADSTDHGADVAGAAEIQPSDYITRAIDLRNAIHLNSVDHRFVQRDLGEIRYVFDTNVVLFFLDPFREFDRVSPFGALDREAAQSLALVTAEYLFSRKLLGQGGSAPMISTWHAKEFDSKIASLMQEPNHGRQGILRLSAAVEHNLHQTITDLMGTAHDHARLRDAIDSSAKSLGGAGKDLVQKAFIAQQFNRLMSSNLLRPLHSDDLALQMRDLPKAPQTDAETEVALNELARLKAMHRGADINNVSEHQLEKDKADVRTAYEVIRLNKASLRERRSKPTRYVLVTTDRTLHNAVLDWLGTDGRDKIGFFPIRRILQFAPFLNINDMPNGIANSELYKDIQHAVEAFLTACDVSVNQLPRALPIWEKPATSKKSNAFEEALREVADQMSRRMSTDPEAHITLDRLAREWQRLGRESVFLNANLLSRRLKPFAALAAFLSKSKDVTQVVEGFMAETVASVERGHVKFGVHHYLHSEIEAAVHHADKGRKRRGMIILRESFSDLDDNEPLVVFLDKMIYGEDEHRAMRARRIMALLDQSNVALHKVFFISACVAFWSSRWDTAESFAKRARQLARTSEDVSARYILEIEYLTLVAKRVRTADTQLTPSEWVEQTLELVPRVNDLRDSALKADDPFSAARFDLEHGMILVSAGFSTCLLGTRAADNRARGYIEDGADKIEQVSRFMRKREEFRGLSATARRYMMAEMIVGLAGCGLYITLLDPEPHRARRKNWHDLAELASKLIDEAQDIVPDIYLLAPQFLELSRETDQNIFEQKRRDLIGKMAQAKTMTTTKLDAAIMAHMTPRIMNMMVPAQS